MPGVLALSDRARYVSFFAYLLRRYQDERRTPFNGPVSHYIKEREYEYALAVRMCPRKCGAGPMGSNRAAPAVAAHPASFDRNESVLSDLGGYGLYYRSPMRSLGLVVPAGTALGQTTTPVDVLIPESERAQKLARNLSTRVRHQCRKIRLVAPPFAAG